MYFFLVDADMKHQMTLHRSGSGGEGGGAHHRKYELHFSCQKNKADCTTNDIVHSLNLRKK
jgi:hypothetical protein